MRTTDLINPLSLWSLWVPLVLLMSIVVMAVWFVRRSQH